MRSFHYSKLLFILLLFQVFNFSCADNVFQHHWKRTNLGGGGAIAMVGATASGMILAASDLSGVYRSTDKGKSWDVIGETNGLLETHINALGFHAKDGNLFLMGTARGVYKTKDGGKTVYQAKLETHSPSTATSKPDGYIESIGMAFSNPSVGYLAHYENWQPELTFMKTTDAGDSWKIVKTSGIPKRAVVVKILVDQHNSELLYALTGKARFRCGPAQLYKSSNGGKNWQRVGKKQWDILDFDLHPVDVNKLYLSTFHANNCGTNGSEYSVEETDFSDYVIEDEKTAAFFASQDGGKHFKKLVDKTGIISVNTKKPELIRLVDILTPFDWNDGAGTWESLDAGKHWSHSGKVSDWNVGYSGNQYLSFAPSYHGLNKTLIKDAFNSDYFYGSFGQWAWGSFDAGKHINNLSTKKIANNEWISTGLDNINGNALDVNADNPNVIYVGGYDLGFWYTKNHGKSWTRAQPNYNQYSNYVWDLGKVPVDSYAAVRGGGSNVNTLISDPQKASTVWATFSKTQYGGETGLFKSTNYGESWIKLSAGLPKGKDAVRMYGLSLDINSPINKRTLYITVDGSVYKSIDGGTSWSLVLKNKTSGGLKFTRVDNFNHNLVFAGGEGGLWRSPDAGKHWQAIGGKYRKEMKNIQKKSRNDIVPTNSDGAIKPWEGIFDIKTDPNNKFRVYVVAYGKGKGLYRSDNAGQSFKKLLTDDFMRGVAIAKHNSNIIYATSSSSYHSGRQGEAPSAGVRYSSDGGKSWKDANANMAWKLAGRVAIDTMDKPSVWLWSPGTGVQYSKSP